MEVGGFICSLHTSVSHVWCSGAREAAALVASSRREGPGSWDLLLRADGCVKLDEAQTVGQIYGEFKVPVVLRCCLFNILI